MARFCAIRELKQQQLNNMTEACIRAIKFEVFFTNVFVVIVVVVA